MFFMPVMMRMMMTVVPIVAVVFCAFWIIRKIAALPQRSNWLIGIGLGAICLIAVAAMFGFFAVRVVKQPESTALSSDQITTLQHIQQDPLPAIWQPQVELDYQTDVDLSQKAAFLRMAPLVAEALIEAIDKQTPSVSMKTASLPPGIKLPIYAQGPNNGIDPSVLSGLMKQVLDEVQRERGIPAIKRSHVVWAPRVDDYLQGQPEPDEVRVAVYLTQSSAPPTSSGNTFSYINKQAVAVVELIGRDWQMQYTQPYAQDAWLSASEQSMSLTQGYLIGRSQTAAVSPEQAREEALQHAADQIERIYADKLHGASVLWGALVQHGNLTDTQTQSLQGQGPTVYRCAVLVDARPEAVQPLIAQAVDAQRQAFNLSQLSWLGLAGLLVVIGLTYFMLQMATKGYYTWTLRVTVAIVVVAVVFLALHWR